MAWRPTEYLIEGELDNTKAGKVTGWMRFTGIQWKVTFDLQGDFHRDIRGTKIHFKGPAMFKELMAETYMKGFARNQTGKVGDITAGLPPYDYVQGRVYIEWYSDENGRVVVELPQESLKIIGEPLPADKSEPISKKEQAENMAGFMQEAVEQFELK
jgi:hypothetical protein